MPHLHRREFLGGLAAGGASGLLNAAENGAFIDIHHHLFPQSYVDAITGLGQPAPPAWNPGSSIDEMDASGIAMAVMSLAPPNVNFPDPELARRLAREVNEYGTKLKEAFTDRFGLFAVLPLPDVDASLKEIEYAFGTLRAEGIGLMTSYGDRWLGDVDFQPVWEELNRRKAVVYTHPHSPDCCANLNTGVPATDIEWATDTTRTIASLLFTGTAAHFPEIRWIFSHGGGTMPYLLSRFQYEEQTHKEREKVLPKGLMHELNRFYYDTAQANHPGALAALSKVAPPSQLLFGTDFPYRKGAEVLGGLAAQKFPAKDLRAIQRDNALRLLPGLKG